METAMISLTKESILLSDLLVDAVNGVYEKARRKSIELLWMKTEIMIMNHCMHLIWNCSINSCSHACAVKRSNCLVLISPSNEVTNTAEQVIFTKERLRAARGTRRGRAMLPSE